MSKAPEVIYLIPGEYDGHEEQELFWCEDPAPGLGSDATDAIKYVRADYVADVQFLKVKNTALKTIFPKIKPKAVIQGWVKCSDQLPTESDADCNDKIWTGYKDPITKAESDVQLKYVNQFLCFALSSPEAHFWMTTGMKRPAPPKQDQES
jgi:hypothetical protein